MKNKLWIIVGGLLAVLVIVGAVGAAAVHAQTPTPPFPADGQGGPGGRGQGRGAHELGQAELDAAAKALGMTAEDLSTQLRSGATLEQIASAKGVDPKTVMEAIRAARPLMLGSAEMDAAAKVLGMSSADLAGEFKSGKGLADVATEKSVDLQTVQDAIQAARNAEMKTQINNAVSSGKISQDKANWLLEGLRKGYLNGPDGFGFGIGPGDPGGLRLPGGLQLQATPSSAP